MRSFPLYKQMDQMDCGPTCLRMISKFYGRHYTAQTVRERSRIGKAGVSMLGISDAADTLGFKSMGVKLTVNKLVSDAPLPCILHWGQNHFVVLYKISEPNLLSKYFKWNDKAGSTSMAEIDLGIPLSQDTPLSIMDSKENESHPNHVENEDAYSATKFYIADPSAGFVCYNFSEFRKIWLTTKHGKDREGIALILEPTPRFFEQDEESETSQSFSNIVRYVWRYKNNLIQLSIGLLIGAFLSLVAPFLAQSLVDVGIGTRDISFVYLILFAQMVLLVSNTGIEFLRSWILLHLSTRINLSILSDFLSKLVRLPVSFFDTKRFGDIMQRVGDHQRIESFLTGHAINVSFSLFNLMLFGLLLAYYHITIFLIALFSSIIYILWIISFLRYRSTLDLKRFQVAASNQNIMVQFIHGMQDIKLAVSERAKIWEWERLQVKLFKWSVKSLSMSQIQQIGAVLINNGKNIFVSFVAARAVIEGELTLGEMVSIQYIMGQFNAPVENMIVFLQSWQDAKLSMDRLNEIHNLGDEEPDNVLVRTEWERKSDIVINDLSFTYPVAGSEPVLKHINLVIPFGKTTAIVGTSGSGKTTLLKILLRFYEPLEGKISLHPRTDCSINIGRMDLREDDGAYSVAFKSKLNHMGVGVDIKMLSHRSWREKCGVVMQDGYLFSDTIARNIAMGDEIIQQDQLFSAATAANIHSYIQSLPLGYHTKIGSEGIGLSQGQKQRILIARSIYKNPDLLLFDEATNSLDANNEAIILENLNSFADGRTVVVVAHRLSTVRKADQIIVLENGEIVERGTHTDLLETRGKYFKLVNNQIELALGS